MAFEYDRKGPYVDVPYQDNPPADAKKITAEFLNDVEDALVQAAEDSATYASKTALAGKVRVDSSAGKRIYVKDNAGVEHLVYSHIKRDISKGYLLNGWKLFYESLHLELSRENHLITLAFPAYSLTGDAATDNVFLELPAGFRPARGGNYGALAPVEAGGNSTAWISKNFNHLSCQARTGLAGVLQWVTDDPWPTTNPFDPA